MTTFTKSGFRDKFRGVMGSKFAAAGTEKPLDEQDLTVELAVVLKFYPDTYEALVQLRNTEKADDSDPDAVEWKVQIATPFISNDIQVMIVPDGEETTDAATGERVIVPGYEVAGLVCAISGDYDTFGGILLGMVHMQDEAALYPEKDIVLIKNGDSTIILKQNSLNINAQHVLINEVDFASLIASLGDVLRNAEDSTIDIQNDKISIDTPILNIGESTSFSDTSNIIKSSDYEITVAPDKIELNGANILVNGEPLTSGPVLPEHTRGIYINSTYYNSFDVDALQAAGITDLFVIASRYTDPKFDVTLPAAIARVAGTGIRVHAWVTCFKDSGGNFTDPADSAVRADVITHCVNCLAQGVDGIHYDYCRYSGVSPHRADEQTPHGFNNINQFLEDAQTALKAIDPNVILSISEQPETTVNKDTYGQDYGTIDPYVEWQCPMVYPGNFGYSSKWLYDVVSYIVAASNTSKCLPTTNTYYSDNEVVNKTREILELEVYHALRGGAIGWNLFRYGLITDYPETDKRTDPSVNIVKKLINFRNVDSATPKTSISLTALDGDADGVYEVVFKLWIPTYSSGRGFYFRPNSQNMDVRGTTASGSVGLHSNTTGLLADIPSGNTTRLDGRVTLYARRDVESVNGVSGDFVVKLYGGTATYYEYRGSLMSTFASNITSIVMGLVSNNFYGKVWLYKIAEGD